MYYYFTSTIKIMLFSEEGGFLSDAPLGTVIKTEIHTGYGLVHEQSQNQQLIYNGHRWYK